VADPPFSVDVDASEGAVPVIRVRGELDFLTAPRLRSALLEVFAAHPGGVMVDLAGTTFMDSIGMSVLIQGAQRLRAEHASLELRPSDEVRKVLDVAGVSPLFRYADR
jgi:anti-anti-sigma factor